jgi:hypothetical protein
VIIQHLANLPSSCPSDSSSLESCISALKSSISALEYSLKITEGSSGHWETFGWLCAVAVGIGIAGEIVVIVSEHFESLEDWERGIIRPPDRPPTWRFWFDIVATLIVLGGVFGEAGATAAVASINSQLRSKTSELRAKSDQLLTLVTKQAGEAQDSARLAEASAKGAGTEADKAQKKADVVAKQAADTGHQLGTAAAKLDAVEKKRAELEKSLIDLAACTAPRILKLDSISVSSGTKTRVDSLRPFAGQKVFLEVIPNDAESRRAVFSLAKALNAAGWDVEKTIMPVDGIPDGVSVQPSASESGDLVDEVAPERFANMRAGDVAYKLVDFLQSFNWQAQSGYPTDSKGDLIKNVKILPVGAIRIQVGLYPATEFVTPPGGKEFTATAAQFEQEREKYKKKSEAERAASDKEKLKQMTPERATAYKALIEDWNKNKQLLSERYSGPCKPLIPLPSPF